jgi:hypothetical protein
MSYNFLVKYNFAYPQSDLRPEDQRWGHGSIPINTDKVPETDEEFKEIARHIGQLGGYERVAIQLPIQPTDHFVEDKGEILEGLIVND